jgi:hypothetical protein
MAPVLHHTDSAILPSLHHRVEQARSDPDVAGRLHAAKAAGPVGGAFAVGCVGHVIERMTPPPSWRQISKGQGRSVAVTAARTRLSPAS